MSIGVSDIIASGSFYDAILEPLGYTRVFEDLRPGERHQAIGYGVVPIEDIFTIKERNSEFLSPGPGFHIAFSAPSREAIKVWHNSYSFLSFRRVTTNILGISDRLALWIRGGYSFLTPYCCIR